MVRCNILIVDEFVRTDKEVISRVFVPFLTSIRSPSYIDLSNDERIKISPEPNRQLYLSSIRGADEWSYQYFLGYINSILESDTRYTTIALPHQFGIKNGYISRDTIEQSFKENQESSEMLAAETVFCLCSMNCIINYLNCLYNLKVIILQHKDEICLSANVAKAEKNNYMAHGQNLNVIKWWSSRKVPNRKIFNDYSVRKYTVSY